MAVFNASASLSLPSFAASLFRPAPQSIKGDSIYKPSSNSNKEGWPLPKFYFEVDMGSDLNIGFQAVDGLESTVEPYEFRDGNSSDFFKQKRPGLVSFGNVTFKKGMFANDRALYKWFKNVATGTLLGDMREVKIRLKDETNSDVFIWTLKGAFVTKFAPTSMDADSGEEVAIEELEIACQYWEMEAGFWSGYANILSASASLLAGGISNAAGLGFSVSGSFSI